MTGYRSEPDELQKAGGVASPDPLTEDERRWIRALQRVLTRCPRRLELMTYGGPALTIIDGPLAVGRPIHDGWAAESGVELGYIKGGPKVHGVS